MLDNHGDMTVTAGCGNGAPQWIAQKAAPELIGKQLKTGFPFSLISSINVKHVGGYDQYGVLSGFLVRHRSFGAVVLS